MLQIFILSDIAQSRSQPISGRLTSQDARSSQRGNNRFFMEPRPRSIGVVRPQIDLTLGQRASTNSIPSPATWAPGLALLRRGRAALTRLWRGQFSMALAELHPRATTGSSRTTLDRYPELFRAASQQMPDATRILSYGCSTGEECATLTRYFPAAEIVGTDINLWSLARARKHFSSERIRFVYF